MPPSDGHHTQQVNQLTGAMTRHAYSGHMQMEIQPVTSQANPPAESEAYVFSPRELRRLANYRAAVVAHFYTDECETSPITTSPITAPRVNSKTAPLRAIASR